LFYENKIQMRVTEEAEFLDIIGTILLATHSRLC
jgi:hypothetical protein